MALLSRDAILQAQDMTKELVSCPEWGGEVYVRVMTGSEREFYERSCTPDDGKLPTDLVRATVAALCLCDEQGGRLFAVQEIEALAMKSWPALRRVFDVAIRLNGLAAASQEALEKKEDAAPSAASGFFLPGPSDAP